MWLLERIEKKTVRQKLDQRLPYLKVTSNIISGHNSTGRGSDKAKQIFHFERDRKSNATANFANNKEMNITLQKNLEMSKNMIENFKKVKSPKVI